MTSLLRMLALMLVFSFAACTGPRSPPGWPTGEERPINPSQASKAVK